LQRLTRIQQVACGFLPVDVREDAEGDPEIELKWVGENRTEALEETLAQIKGKVIIWSRFSVCIERLTKHFGQAAVKYRGGMGHEERKDAKKRFLTDPKCLYMIAQPQSAGTGVDGLQKIARYSIYWSNSHNAQHRLQSERRTWRLGQNDQCFYLDMLAKGTFDERIRETLIMRQNVSKGILSDIAKWKRTANAKIEVL
jgi:SNF2 family DNA or RNA helicase